MSENTARINDVMENRAHARLSELADRAKQEQLHGKVTVEITYQHGHARHVRRMIEGTDK